MICSNKWQTDRAVRVNMEGRLKSSLSIGGSIARCNYVVSITEPLVLVLKLVDSDDKPTMGETIFHNNIWIDEILESVDHRWRDQLHQDIHTTSNL
ncbi:hypothetical protein AMTRI_Chr13g85690 [Amborella trichopoda]